MNRTGRVLPQSSVETTPSAPAIHVPNDEIPVAVPYEIELNTLRQSISRAPGPQGDQHVQEFSLPPADGGKDAWLVLAAAFILETLAWGVPYTFGVFQEYYMNQSEFEEERSRIAIIGTIAFGIMYLGSPISLLGLQRWPQFRRRSSVIGLSIVMAALVSTSFATSVWQLILTQGVLYAIGAAMLYYPVLLLLDEWFVRKKGLAFGIAWGGTGFSGVFFPFFISWSLQQYSHRATLRILAVVYAVLATPTIFFLKPRLPVSRVIGATSYSVRFAWTKPFLPCQIGIILQSLGYFMPGVFLPTYARYLGYSGGVATATVTLINSGFFIGCILSGMLVDRWHITNVILLSTMGASLSVVLLWGLSGTATLICIFAFLYGIFSGGYASTLPGIVQEAKRRNPRVETGLAYALLVASRGVGSVVSGPLSDALLKADPLAHGFSYGYGSRYAVIIVFAGVSNALGSAAFVSRRLGWW